MGVLTQIKCHLSLRNYLMFVSTLAIVALQVCRTYCDSVYKKGHVYTLNALDVNGKLVPLSTFRGKVLLVVNVATYCGFTQNHYSELVEIQKKFGTRRFNVLAFPCNQFGEQEPDSNEEIIEFLKQMYKVNFPVFAKIDTVGENIHPLYQYLADITGKSPNWNFWKYLIDHKGNIIETWSTATTVESLTATIQEAVDNVPVRNEL